MTSHIFKLPFSAQEKLYENKTTVDQKWIIVIVVLICSLRCALSRWLWCSVGENASWAAGELFCFNTKSGHRAKFGNKAESFYPGTHPIHSLVWLEPWSRSENPVFDPFTPPTVEISTRADSNVMRYMCQQPAFNHTDKLWHRLLTLDSTVVLANHP